MAKKAIKQIETDTSDQYIRSDIQTAIQQILELIENERIATTTKIDAIITQCISECNHHNGIPVLPDDASEHLVKGLVNVKPSDNQDPESSRIANDKKHEAIMHICSLPIK